MFVYKIANGVPISVPFFFYPEGVSEVKDIVPQYKVHEVYCGVGGIVLC